MLFLGNNFLNFTSTYSSIDEIKHIIFSDENKNILDNYELGKISTSKFYKSWSKLLNLKISEKKFLEIFWSIFTENKAFTKILDKLKDSPKVILSNINPFHWNIAKEFNIIKNYFEDKNCIRSYNLWIKKPDKEIYLY